MASNGDSSRLTSSGLKIELKDGARVETLDLDTYAPWSTGDGEDGELRTSVEALLLRFEDGQELKLPMGQVEVLEPSEKGVASAFGLEGMSFEGMEGEQLVFWRVQAPSPGLTSPAQLAWPQVWAGTGYEAWPEEKLAIDASRVARVTSAGREVWPRAAAEPEPASSHG